MGLLFNRRKDDPLLGWFGKLPSVGDFVGRGLPAGLCTRIHAWFSEGITELPKRCGPEWRDVYRLAPLWHFVMAPGAWDMRILLGCVAPSTDRVGRCSPVIVLRSVGADELGLNLPPRSRWLGEVDVALRRAVAGECSADLLKDALESAHSRDVAARDDPSLASAILADLGIAPAVEAVSWHCWPELPNLLQQQRGRSFWWCEPLPHELPCRVIHGGEPDADLLARLLGKWGEP